MFLIGKVEDCPPFSGMVLRDSPNQATLKVREKGERKGPAMWPSETLFNIFLSMIEGFS